MFESCSMNPSANRRSYCVAGTDCHQAEKITLVSLIISSSAALQCYLSYLKVCTAVRTIYHASDSENIYLELTTPVGMGNQ